ncbi:helix-turn-helix domain-containing protein [Clostridium sp. YIM B02500]|uniref:helix-turn-helix domain-containing protein n=1 Tax=Clostridium sp. YIM B02500 TaxID=2910681 RepID=UPI001EEE23A5|nr:helix-turn-helix domain-containing protein [Clostridium sp. YIM B02500]
MIENWYALFIAILKDVSIDKALSLMNVSARRTCMRKNHKKIIRKSKYSDEFMEQISKMKEEGMFYKDIGKVFNMTKCQVEGALRMHKNRKTTKDTGK